MIKTVTFVSKDPKATRKVAFTRQASGPSDLAPPRLWNVEEAGTMVPLLDYILAYVNPHLWDVYLGEELIQYGGQIWTRPFGVE